MCIHICIHMCRHTHTHTHTHSHIPALRLALNSLALWGWPFCLHPLIARMIDLYHCTQHDSFFCFVFYLFFQIGSWYVAQGNLNLIKIFLSLPLMCWHSYCWELSYLTTTRGFLVCFVFEIKSCYVAQTVFQVPHLPASTSQMLGLQCVFPWWACFNVILLLLF